MSEERNNLGEAGLFLHNLLQIPYYDVIIEVIQDKVTSLEYYGPIARGWLGHALCTDMKVREVLFKNPYLDVRPFFFYTKNYEDIIEINLKFIGFSKLFLMEVIHCLETKIESHIGGVNCRISRVKLFEEKMRPIKLDKNVTIKFSSPLALEKGGELLHTPSLTDITRSLVRSANRFCKYYLKECYPIHIPQSLLEDTYTIVDFDVRPFSWNHRNMRGGILPLNGIIGHVKYSSNGVRREMESILGLTQVFQIGKWVNYGFGKIEVDGLGSQ